MLRYLLLYCRCQSWHQAHLMALRGLWVKKMYCLPYVTLSAAALSRHRNSGATSTFSTPNMISKMEARSSSLTSPPSSCSYICRTRTRTRHTAHTQSQRHASRLLSGAAGHRRWRWSHLEGQLQGLHGRRRPVDGGQSHDVAPDVDPSVFLRWKQTTPLLAQRWSSSLLVVQLQLWCFVLRRFTNKHTTNQFHLLFLIPTTIDIVVSHWRHQNYTYTRVKLWRKQEV